MSASRPKVTIVMPVYNGARYLNEAIDSALAQTYENVEIVVVNDGSTDGGRTEEIARSYGDRIRFLSKPNGGVATALNHGIERATGAYFSWLSHDDAYVPDKIRREIDYVTRLGRDVIVYSDYERMDEVSRTISVHRLPHFEPTQFRAAFIRHGLISGCTLLIPMACLRATGLFRTDLRTTNDYAKWFELSSRYEFHHLPEVLIRSRFHPEQDTQRLGALHRRECDALFADALRALSIEEIRTLPEPVPLFYMELAYAYWLAGYPSASRRALRRAAASLVTSPGRGDFAACGRQVWARIVRFGRRRIRRVLGR